MPLKKFIPFNPTIPLHRLYLKEIVLNAEVDLCAKMCMCEILERGYLIIIDDWLA